MNPETVDIKPQENIIQEKLDTPVVQNNADKAPVSEEKPEDPNWRAFREARKKDRLEKEAAERRAAEKEAEVAALKAAMEAAFAKNPGPIARSSGRESYDYANEETEDERIEKKIQAAIAQREQQYERELQQREQQEYPARLSQAYPDFKNTIASENLDYLEYHYPEVAGPLSRLPEGFDKWADIYRAVKKFVPNSTTAKKDAARADANYQKPRSISSPGMTQNKDFSGSAILSEDQKKSNWERMQKTLKGLA